MAQWLRLRSMVGAAVTSIARGVRLPIGIGMFPGMEALHTRGIHRNPNIARSQIIVLAIHHANVFSTVPNIGFRNRCRHHDRRRDHNRCRGRRPGMRQSKRNSHHCYGHNRLNTPFHTQFLSMRGVSRRVRVFVPHHACQPDWSARRRKRFRISQSSIGKSQTTALSFINLFHMLSHGGANTSWRRSKG